MKASELQAYVGKTGILTLEGLKMPVKILDSKIAYGEVRVLVTPDMENGEGQMWVAVWRVKVDR